MTQGSWDDVRAHGRKRRALLQRPKILVGRTGAYSKTLTFTLSTITP
jgi:hypothetical protein